ncbi:hypothetical protein ASD67_04230 [Sphingopyxis sp. Root1497]|uniref:hypothetical protein n=1 Tax=Sphingopyxis sp. Root1497 TaxID=1736474 RepID=UPI000714F319|nr:hypothetical protein [Sphingopyxis sp. Root1497]KQZ63766.1 hypothetical protein ASD67_04230 [Sphingopyxis sp. Root1497]
MRYWPFLLFALLISAIGALVYGLTSSPAKPVPVKEPIEESSALRVGERIRVVPAPDAVEVRLFVEGVPHRTTARVNQLINNPDGILLTAGQRAILDRSVHRYRAKPSEMGKYDMPACFIPHHFFRYYDKDGRQIGELAVCYCCGDIRVTPYTYGPNGDRSEVWDFDYDGVKKMLKEMDVPTDIDCVGHARF